MHVVGSWSGTCGSLISRNVHNSWSIYDKMIRYNGFIDLIVYFGMVLIRFSSML